jgi:tetratricopeptide (TPR) repeat protein
MKRFLIIFAASATMLLLCTQWRLPQSTAEPIPAGESVPASLDTDARAPEAADALARFKARDFDGALRLWTKAVKANSDLPPVQVIMAQLYLQANMPKEAHSALKAAVRDAPSDPDAYILSAALATYEGDLAKAEASYQKAESLVATFKGSEKRKETLRPRIYLGLAGVSEARKDWVGAQRIYEKWLKLDPRNAAVMQRIGCCLALQKNVRGALEKFREAAKLNAEPLPPEATLAQFYQESGDRENAEKWLAAALAAAPNDLKTHLLAGTWALEAGQVDEAQKHVRLAMELDPNSLEVKLLRGSTAVFQREYDLAELVCESVLEQSPRSFLASNNLAMALIQQKKKAKHNRALELAEANARKYPKSPVAASTYAWVLYKLGRLEDANKALQTAHPDENSDVDTAYIFARISVDRGQKAEARKALEHGLKKGGPSMFRKEAEALLAALKR